VDLRRVCEQFDLGGEFLSAAPHGSGHINETFLVQTGGQAGPRRVVLQKINRRVFPDPTGMMGNIERVVEHLRRKAAEAGRLDARRTLTLLPARSGACWWRDEEGETWRASPFIEGASSVDVAQSADQVYQAARAFGAFQRQLMDLPPPPLRETIPRFHDTTRRLRDLERAAGAAPTDRKDLARAEIDFACSRSDLAGRLAGLHRQGVLASRTVHNDTKLNNVLLDETTGEGLCVIDLDTVMPGLGAWDFGDLVRSAANPAAEDERDLRKVQVEESFFASIARGWIEALGDLLAPAERSSLLLGAEVITLECGIRFLTDFLEGDRYFRIRRPQQNLDRARAQLAFLRSLEASEERLAALLLSPGP